MSDRYEAERDATRDGREAFGVIDHKPFAIAWVRGHDGKDLKFATREEAQGWIDLRRRRPRETATFHA